MPNFVIAIIFFLASLVGMPAEKNLDRATDGTIISTVCVDFASDRGACFASDGAYTSYDCPGGCTGNFYFEPR